MTAETPPPQSETGAGNGDLAGRRGRDQGSATVADLDTYRRRRSARLVWLHLCRCGLDNPISAAVLADLPVNEETCG
ncbi:hypothetical protein FraEuI1c_6435 [Pseudofrankia inefficax]|uniref:Uncharacterized protein n=1 Tax=Pseudofrankia inefficax (strain DSM 45817 / CECT 9037 / DDB 130130 / EuI1c) TaxID=298654 RepID=E3J752_PSEI1|nr:hypothetical protein FraEuI1c_6435 [Pseudofrankia inefficax]